MSIFLHIEGIKGEAADANHKNWIDVESIEWKLHRKISSHTSTRGDRESANPEYSELLLFKRIDIATPALFLESCCGRGKTIIIECTKTGVGNSGDVFMQYQLKNAVVSYYKVCAKNKRARRPLEAIRISFAQMQQRYTPYSEDNITEAPMAVGYDATTNTIV